MEYRDLEHVLRIADEHNEDLHGWCVRQRRRESVRRVTLAACILVGCCMSYSSSIGAPLYDQITSTGEAGNDHVCQMIQESIEGLSEL